LDTLLEKKDLTLEQIFDEENILNELKNSGSNKFAKFIINNPKNYEQMINYILTFDIDSNDEKKMIRY